MVHVVKYHFAKNKIDYPIIIHLTNTGTVPIFTISGKQNLTIQEHLKSLGTSQSFPQCMTAVSDLSQFYDLKKCLT